MRPATLGPYRPAPGADQRWPGSRAKKTPGQGPGVFLLPGVGRVVNDQRSALPVVGTVPVIGKPFWSTAATVAEPARGV